MDKLIEARRLLGRTDGPDSAHDDGKAAGSPEFDAVPGVNPSVVLISPNPECLALIRRILEAQRATIAKEFAAYPTYAGLDSLGGLDVNVLVVDIDPDLDVAMDVVEGICLRQPSATVMVYSSTANGERMVRAMRSGAREFLTGTVSATVLQEALVRAVARHSQQVKRVAGNTLVFWSAKGGSGVTTLATNFAIALRAETSDEVALIDLNPRLGDVSVLLGLTPRFSIAEALKNPKRVDRDLISTLMAEHPSGISVLAAPDTYDDSTQADNRSVGKLLDVLRSRYPYVVVDAGRHLGGAESLAQLASTIYLVTQLDVPSLRNTQRLISYIRDVGGRNIELIVNRYESRKPEFDDDQIAKALGLEPKWKIVNDYPAARRSSNTGKPLLQEKSAVSTALRALACVAAGKGAPREKKKAFSLFGR